MAGLPLQMWSSGQRGPATGVVGRRGLDRLDRRRRGHSVVTPIERAVPSTIFIAASTSLALRSGILVVAISRTWSLVSRPTFSLWGTPEPFWRPAAFLMSSAAGGVLVMNVNDRSS